MVAQGDSCPAGTLSQVVGSVQLPEVGTLSWSGVGGAAQRIF